MTATERQRRWRAKMRKQDASLQTKAKHARARERARSAYVPMPPGITYWREVTVETTHGPQTIMTPVTRPPAACESDLADGDVLALIEQLMAIARKRKLPLGN